MGQCCVSGEGAVKVETLQVQADQKDEQQPAVVAAKIEEPTVEEAAPPAPKEEEAPAVQEKAAAPTTNVVTFEFDGSQTDITLSGAPLGMSYTTNVYPVVVVKTADAGNAKAAGVKIGMKVVKVEGEDMRNCDFKTVDAAIKALAKKLAA